MERCTFSSFLQLAVVLQRRRRFVVVRADLTCPSADLPPAPTFFFFFFFDEILRFVPLLVSPVNRPPAPVCARVSVLFLFVCVCVCFVRVCYRSCKQDGCVICGGDRPPVPRHRLRSSHPPLLGLRAPPIAPVTRARAPTRTLDPVLNGWTAASLALQLFQGRGTLLTGGPPRVQARRRAEIVERDATSDPPECAPSE